MSVQRCPVYQEIDYGIKCARVRGHSGTCDQHSDEYVIAVLAESQDVTADLRRKELETERWPGDWRAGTQEGGEW